MYKVKLLPTFSYISIVVSAGFRKTGHKSYFERFGGAESFATSISLEKLDRSVSSSCPYFWRQFSAILVASQPYFVNIPLVRSNIKGCLKAFFLNKIHHARAIMLFSLFISSAICDRPTKRLRNLRTVYPLKRKTFSSRPLYCFLYH